MKEVIDYCKHPPPTGDGVWGGWENRQVASLSIDSGAHSLFNKHIVKAGGKFNKHANKRTSLDKYAFYKTAEFRQYLDAYAAFIKKYESGIDWYVNVDVIYHPQMSWDALKYLEEHHGLKPVPVLHHRTPMSWIHKHLEAGYTFLGLGGIGQKSNKRHYAKWADQVFNILCDFPDRKPRVRTHCFSLTSWELFVRWPWWSVDSSSWAKAAGYGTIYVPHRVKGRWAFDRPPFITACSDDSKARSRFGQHYHSFSPEAKREMRDWWDYIKVPLGRKLKPGERHPWAAERKDGTRYVPGVFTDYGTRAVANMRYFDLLARSVPEWPWPWTGYKRGFDFHLEDR